MTKSEGANELVTSLLDDLRDRLLPEKGAEFEISYFNGEEPVKYGEEPHTWVNAVSEGLRVVCYGPEFRVSHARQRKPMIPSIMVGPDGNYRRALRIALNGDPLGNDADWYIHILGNLIVVSHEKLNVAQLVGDESLTEKDQRILGKLKVAARAEPHTGTFVVPDHEVTRILEEEK
jgi:hypothetical protein